MAPKYLLAIVPPENINKIAESFRKKFGKHNGYKTSPHITVYPPFYLNSVKEENLIENLQKVMGDVKSKKITFDSVDYFKHRRTVAFFKPGGKSEQYLCGILQKVLPVLTGNIKDAYRDYHISIDSYQPHLTIRERLPTYEARKIKSDPEINKVVLSFKVSSLVLFKQEGNTHAWNPVANILLMNSGKYFGKV